VKPILAVVKPLAIEFYALTGNGSGKRSACQETEIQ
jgi:hypothetical protein